MGFATSSLSAVSSPVTKAPLTITEVAQAVTLNGPENTLEVYNAAVANKIYFGDAGVTAATGIPLVPGEAKIWVAVENGFKVWFICTAGQTAELRQNTYRGR